MSTLSRSLPLLYERMRTGKSTEDDVRLVAKIISELTESSGDTTLVFYDKNIGDDLPCKCGHVYYRHFDSYEDMRPIGCKYCSCFHFEEKQLD